MNTSRTAAPISTAPERRCNSMPGEVIRSWGEKKCPNSHTSSTLQMPRLPYTTFRPAASPNLPMAQIRISDCIAISDTPNLPDEHQPGHYETIDRGDWAMGYIQYQYRRDEVDQSSIRRHAALQYWTLKPATRTS